jgi:tetratricopeptide (TPR) repeat protein
MDTRPLVIAGEIHLQLGHFDKAEKNAKEAYRRDCLDPRAVVLLADVYLKTGKGSEALDIIEKAMGSGKNAELYMVAKVETTLKVYGHTTALPLAEDLVKRLPESASAWRILAQTYFSANMQQDAQSAAKTALKISPFDSSMRVLLGNISAAEGQLDQAISHYVDAIHVRTNEIDAYLALAKVYESRREFQEALKVLNQAVELKPRDNRPYLQAAQMYKEARDYQSAEQILRLASGVLPEEPTIQRQLLAISALNLVHKSQKAGAHQ